MTLPGASHGDIHMGDARAADVRGKQAIAGAMQGNEGLPWVEKYRPSLLAEIVHHEDIIGTLRRFVSENRVPHLLLYGPPGTGKTTTALALANLLYAKDRAAMVLELNASDERGIAVVRDQIKTFAGTRTFATSHAASGHACKLIILDECDAMTSAAQNALRRVMEKYVRNVRFILICNYVGQIIPALQSRCTRFRFAPLPREALLCRIGHVAANEGVTLDAGAADAIIALANGDMRRILNIMQSATCHALAGGQAAPHISEDLVYAISASARPADIDHIFKVLLDQSDFATALSSMPVNQRCHLNMLTLLKCVAIAAIQVERGLATVDIVTAMADRLATIEVPNEMRIVITKHLADIEYRLAGSTADALQLAAVVGAFFLGRHYAAPIVS